MKVSNRGLFEIATHEGVVLNPYLDSVNVLTFGIGHTASAGSPDPKDIPIVGEDQFVERTVMAFKVFAEDIKKFEDRVNDAVKVPVSQAEFDALVSFDLNTGGIYKANLTKSLNAGNKAAAAGDANSGFMGWKIPSSIIPRRRKEQKLFATGIYSGKKAPLYSINRRQKPVKIGELDYDTFIKHYRDNKVVVSDKYQEEEAQAVTYSNSWIAKLLSWLSSLFK